MLSVQQIEKRIVWISTAFGLSLFGLAALAVGIFNIGLPTCITDIKPFQTGEVIVHSPNHYEVHWVARMWKFEPEDVEIPAGSMVDIYLSAADVTHGFLIPGTNVNLMAVPGVVNYARVKFEKPRDYQILCHEFCGTGHESMATTIHVVDPTLQRGTTALVSLTTKPSDPGYKLLQAKTCIACHSVDGRPGIGPTFKGLFGHEVKLTDGSTISADESYIRDSIHDPNARVVNGFLPAMPKLPVTDAEINQIIDYMKTIQ
jgi:cytochrome c oxidase subunit II